MFTQCKDRDEAEKFLQDKKVAFVTEDFRIYDSIELWDNALCYKFTAEAAYALEDLKLNIERQQDGMTEMCFLEIEQNAKELTENFKKVVELLKINPRKKGKGS